jgi:uncharacterized membrane protein
VAPEVKAGPGDRLKAEALGLVGALGDRALGSVRDRVKSTAGRLTDYADEGAGPGLMTAVTGARDKTKGKDNASDKDKAEGKDKDSRGGQGRNLKVTNIVESIDVGAPIGLVYDQWTQFTEFPSFMKKVENVEQTEEQTLNWKAQVLWSHRTWESTIVEQVPEDKIIWRSKGAKGYVDGAVTFHQLAPSLTRILLVLEYHPQGFFEHTGNIWRAQGRRVRLELKHFRRHVMSEVLLHPDEVKGWRGVISDGEVVPDDEDTAPEPDENQDDDQRKRDEERPRRVTRRATTRGGRSS